MQRQFNFISRSFKSGKFSLQTIKELIYYTRAYKNVLTNDQVAILLSIPINVLEYDVYLKNPQKWQEERGEYFAGNIVLSMVGTGYLSKLKKRFSEGKFELEDIISIARHVKKDYLKLLEASEYLLRNVEVTIRDDVDLLNYSTFTNCGDVFARYVDKAIWLDF